MEVLTGECERQVREHDVPCYLYSNLISFGKRWATVARQQFPNMHENSNAQHIHVNCVVVAVFDFGKVIFYVMTMVPLSSNQYRSDLHLKQLVVAATATWCPLSLLSIDNTTLLGYARMLHVQGAGLAGAVVKRA